MNNSNSVIPHKLTKTEIIENYWVEYLQYLVNEPIHEPLTTLATDDYFWEWYIYYNMEQTK